MSDDEYLSDEEKEDLAQHEEAQRARRRANKDIELEVFDAVGGRVEEQEIQGELAAPAENEISWSVAGYASGLYICRLEARGENGRRETAFVKMAVSR